MHPIKLLSWNILGKQAGDLAACKVRYPDLNNWAKKFQTLISQIISFKVDIICLQEVDDNTKTEFVSTLKNHGFYFAAYEPKKSNGGCLILYKSSRFNLLNHYGTSLKISDELGACAWATLQCKKSMQSILIGSLHLHWQNQKGQLQLLAQELKRKSMTPIIIAGDFNTPYPTMTQEVIPLLNSQSLLDNEIQIFEHSSWTAQPPHHKDPSCLESLDHVLFSNDLLLDLSNSFVANPAQTYKDDKVTTLNTVKNPNKIAIPNDTCPSDHLPIVTTLNFTKHRLK